MRPWTAPAAPGAAAASGGGHSLKAIGTRVLRNPGWGPDASKSILLEKAVFRSQHLFFGASHMDRRRPVVRVRVLGKGGRGWSGRSIPGPKSVANEPASIWGFDYNFTDYTFRRHIFILRLIPCQRGEIQVFLLNMKFKVFIMFSYEL